MTTGVPRLLELLADELRRVSSRPVAHPGSLSWAMAEHLISRARIGCVPGADFGAHGEGHIRFCFARDRRELTGALESMGRVFSGDSRPQQHSS